MTAIIVQHIRRPVGLLAGAGMIGLGLAALTPGSANAADLTCVATPGLEAVQVDGAAACGARIDETSRAVARALDGVAFARGEVGGNAFGFAHSGGVAAAETVSGGVGAMSVGRDSVSIVSPDPGTFALALSLVRGQTFVGTAEEGVRCDAGAGIAVNLTTGQICVSDGTTTWRTPQA